MELLSRIGELSALVWWIFKVSSPGNMISEYRSFSARLRCLRKFLILTCKSRLWRRTQIVPKLGTKSKYDNVNVCTYLYGMPLTSENDFQLAINLFKLLILLVPLKWGNTYLNIAFGILFAVLKTLFSFSFLPTDLRYILQSNAEVDTVAPWLCRTINKRYG